MKVYLLEYDDGMETKIKGIYSTKDKAKEAAKELEYGLGEWITEYEVE